MRASPALLLTLWACAKQAPVPAAPDDPGRPVAEVPEPDANPYPTEVYGEVVFSEDVVNVVPGGDIDGDGLADLLIALPASERVQVVFGSRLSQMRPGEAILFDRTLHSLKPGDGFGTSVAGIGDVDGDGTGDVLVGAPRWDAGTGDAGAAWLMLGKTLRDEPMAGLDAAWCFYWGIRNDFIGQGLYSLGDLDGDGKNEVLFTGYRRGYVVPGSQIASYERMYLPEEAPTMIMGTPEGTRFEVRALPAGDVRGDGWGGALVMWPGENGKTWMFHGGQIGTKMVNLPSDGWGRFITPGTWQGTAAAAVDLNGDHRPDPVIGWQGDRYTLTAVDAGYFATASEVDVSSAGFLTLEADPAWDINDVTSLGDLDGDGYAEMAVGTRMEGAAFTARVYVFRGINLRDSPTATLADADLVFDYKVDRQSFWWTTNVLSPGDVNGDGLDDLVVLLQGRGWTDPLHTAQPRVVVHLSPWTWK